LLFIPKPEHSRPRPKAQGQGQRIPRPRPRNLALRLRPRPRPRINIPVQMSHRKSYFTCVVVVRGLGFNGVLAVAIIILVVSSLPCGLSALICYLKWRRPTSSSRRRPPVQVRTRPPVVRPVLIRPASFQPRFIPRRPLYF